MEEKKRKRKAWMDGPRAGLLFKTKRDGRGWRAKNGNSLRRRHGHKEDRQDGLLALVITVCVCALLCCIICSVSVLHTSHSVTTDTERHLDE